MSLAPRSSPAGRDESPASEVEFNRARRAVELGLATESAVEAALDAEDRAGGGGPGLLARLGLSPAQRLALEGPPPPPEAALALRDPDRLVGRFVLVSRLGSGGMGDVYRAFDLKLARFVALKLLRRIDDERARACFEREARVAARLDLPNVAAIHDVGEHRGAPSIAMQLVEGSTLAAAVAEGRFDARRAAATIRDAARAIEGAHRLGIVHRDLKPGNLMLDRDGRLFVMDFGLAKPPVELRQGSSLTGSGFVVGTPEYMAPEQARGAGGAVDARSDVYALGACLFELLAGRAPFVARDRGEVIAQVLRDPPPSLRALAPDAPRALEAIVRRCLEKAPERRYPGAADLAADLDRFLAGEPVAAPTPSRLHALRRHRTALAGAAIVAAIGAVALFAFLLRPDPAPGRAALSPPTPRLLASDSGITQMRSLGVGAGRIFAGAGGPAGQFVLTVPPGGGPSARLVENVDAVWGVAAIGDELFWADNNSEPPNGGSRIYRGRLDGRGEPTIIYAGKPVGTTIEDICCLATDGERLFVSDEVGGRVFRLERDGSDLRLLGPPRYEGGFTTEHANAIAYAAGTVYYVNGGLGQETLAVPLTAVEEIAPEVVAFAADGGAPPRRLHAGPPLLRPRGIAVRGDRIYVGDPGAGNAIWVFESAGGPPTVLVSGPPFVHIVALALAEDGRSLLVADDGDSIDSHNRFVDGPASVWRLDLRD